MAKPTIKFTAVAYDINGHTGYRPQLESQDGLYDLDFCKEVVTEKRLAMSADELLHAIEMLGEVGPAKVAADGRPRGVTKLLKYNRFAKGTLESPTSAWNDSCEAYVRAQLMSDTAKVIDATFVNTAEGINVKLDNVTWLGAQTVVNVIKVGKSFAAYGKHMEWITGDTASLTVGTNTYALTCTESDVAHATFSWPAGLAPEAGTQALFVMKSRGGISEGEAYTSKKTVTILSADPLKDLTVSAFKITDTSATDGPFELSGENLDAASKNASGKYLVTVKDTTAGGSSATAECTLSDGKLVGKTGFACVRGDVCEVSVTVDTARTDVTQGTVTKTLVAE